MFYVKANNIKMAVETYGDPDKPALMVLHGGATSIAGYRTWKRKKFLDRMTKNFFVVLFDRRCHGKTGFPESFTFEEQATDVVALMDALCIDKAAVMGESAGTYVGGRTAILFPERVSHLVLCVPHDRAEGGTPAAAYFKRNNIDQTKLSFEEVMKLIDAAAYAPTTPASLKDKFMAFSVQAEAEAGVQFTPEQTAAAYAAMAVWDNRPGYATLEVPTLVMSGKYDQLCPAEIGREIASLVKNSKYVEFEHSGHSLSVEQEDEMIDTVEDFLLNH
ncbi:MAG TPA: alpha/beta hydrolase [Candidatus Fournierella merdigallinarum]|nr:alpha/beta hydrolase [Candidatus Fournierella merdigallinarum]